MKKDEIIKKAKEMLHRRENALNEFEVILSAGICPTCGKNLILRTNKWTTEEKRGLIFKKKAKILHKRDYFACPDDHPIIGVDGENKSYPGCVEYNGLKNPNNVIRDYWTEYYSEDDDESF